MHTRRTITMAPLSVAVAAAAALVLGACSTEDLAEKAAEKAIERQLEADGQEGDVDIDLDGGEIRVAGPDGSAVINFDTDGQGNVSIQGEGSDGAIDIEVGGDGELTVISSPEGEMVFGTDELPADFPAAVPVPAGLTVVSATSMTADDGQSFVVTGSAPTAFLDATEAYVAALTGAGFTQQSLTESPEGTFFSYASDTWNVTCGMFASASGSGTDLNITVFPVGG